MEFLQSNEGALCTLLSDHFEKVMEHVEDMITVKEHKTIGKQDGKERIKSLLAFIHQKGEDNCQKFVAILRKDFPEIQKLCSNKGPQVYADQGSTIVASETANTNMKSYKMEVNVDGCQGGKHGPSQVPPPAFPNSGSSMVATNNSHIFAPKLTNSNVNEDVSFCFNYTSGSSAKSSKPQLSGANAASAGKRRSCPTISDKRGFFKDNISALTQNVKNVQPILDELKQKSFHTEMASNVRAEKTPQEQMRKILESTTTKAAAEALFQALLIHEKDLMKELTESD
ncbi:uncharacterized protein si:dkey-10c21.1 [Clupea harengus]|uniref:Uncharacterized protein si:dkey-10c21.1 n=1 Tax=Clupea harengus TaxID=7950 RepID=A0A6P8G5T8_CLUHA|nr:uncharacterized protein si:dkey-10c21.1 [Clupea harengus]